MDGICVGELPTFKPQAGLKSGGVERPGHFSMARDILHSYPHEYAN